MPRRDPRRLNPSVRATANEALFDRAVRHALYLEGLKTREVDRIISFLEEKTLPDLLEVLQRRLARIATRGFDTGLETTKRLRDMRDALDTIISTGMRGARDLLEKDLTEIASLEARLQAKFVSESSPVNIEWTVPSAPKLRQAILGRPFQGRVLRDWWGRVDQTFRGTIREQVTIGITEGETLPQIVTRLWGTSRRAFGTGSVRKVKSGIEAVVRTAVNHTGTVSRHRSYEENQDLVKGWQFVATLDSRTTFTCMSLDGNVYGVGRGPKPPRHFGCRSADVPVLRSAAGLGLKPLELPPEERAALGGEVAGSLTFPQWLRTQPAAIQNLALKSRARGKAFRAGLISVENFESDLRLYLTPNQIERLEEGLGLATRLAA